MMIPESMPVEIDYTYLMDYLKDLARPRDRVTAMLRSGDIVRVKKGLYVRNSAQVPFSRELLANLIYGPSYVSLEYALAYHGLIPEGVQTVTCVTSGRNKSFDTPIGRFEYSHLGLRYFPFGVTRIEIDGSRAFLTASAEKALFDVLFLRTPRLTRNEIAEHLFGNLRIDESEFDRLDFRQIDAILSNSPRPSIVALRTLIASRKGGR